MLLKRGGPRPLVDLSASSHLVQRKSIMHLNQQLSLEASYDPQLDTESSGLCDPIDS